MTDQEKEQLEKLKRQKQKQLDRQNKFANENYDRIAFVTQKGNREIIRKFYTEKGYSSLADYFINLAIRDGCPITTKDKKQDQEQPQENLEEKKLNFLSPEEIAELPF